MVSVFVIRKCNDIRIVLENLCHLAIIVFFILWGVCVSVCVCVMLTSAQSTLYTSSII